MVAAMLGYSASDARFVIEEDRDAVLLLALLLLLLLSRLFLLLSLPA